MKVVSCNVSVSTLSEHINILNGNHEYHGGLLRGNFHILLVTFFYVDGKDCEETEWSQEKSTLTMAILLK